MMDGRTREAGGSGLRPGIPALGRHFPGYDRRLRADALHFLGRALLLSCILPSSVLLLIGCAERPTLRLVLDYPPERLRALEAEVLPRLEKKAACRIEVFPYSHACSLGSLLGGDAPADLVRLPLEALPDLRRRNLLSPWPASAAPALGREYFLVEWGGAGDSVFLVPESFETPVLVFNKALVAQALAWWEESSVPGGRMQEGPALDGRAPDREPEGKPDREEDRESDGKPAREADRKTDRGSDRETDRKVPESRLRTEKADPRREAIEKTLIRYTDHGLPPGYALERDVNAWDELDLFVAGSFWRDLEVGSPRPRLRLLPAHPHAAARTLIDRCRRRGASAEEIEGLRGRAVAETFRWMALLHREGIAGTGRGSGSEDGRAPAEGPALFEALPEEAHAFLQGRGEGWGIALVPGAFLPGAFNAGASPAGGRALSTGFQGFALPRRSRHPEKALLLARLLTESRLRVSEGLRHGAMPMRQDLLGEMRLVFGGRIAGEVFAAVSQQLLLNGENRPFAGKSPEPLERRYLAAFDALVRQNAVPDLEVKAVEAHLETLGGDGSGNRP